MKMECQTFTKDEEMIFQMKEKFINFKQNILQLELQIKEEREKNENLKLKMEKKLIEKVENKNLVTDFEEMSKKYENLENQCTEKIKENKKLVVEIYKNNTNRLLEIIFLSNGLNI